MRADLGSIEVVEVVARALYILRRHLHTLGGATLLYTAVSQAVVVGGWLVLQPRSPNLLPTALVFANAIGIVVMVTLGFLYMGLMAQLLASIHFDHPVGLVDAVRSLVRHGRWLLVAGLAVGAASCALCLPLSRYLAEVSLRQIGGSPPPMDTGILLGYAGLVVALFFCFFRLSFFFPSIVLEENGPLEAVQRSNDVSRGHESTLLAVGLASSLLSYLVYRIVNSILSQWFAPTVVELAMLVLGALIDLLPLVAFYELYFEIMLRRADFPIPRFIDDLANEGDGSAHTRAPVRAVAPSVDSLTEARTRFRDALKASQASAAAVSLPAEGGSVVATGPCSPQRFEAPAFGAPASLPAAGPEGTAATQVIAAVDARGSEVGEDVRLAEPSPTGERTGEVLEALALPEKALPVDMGAMRSESAEVAVPVEEPSQLQDEPEALFEEPEALFEEPEALSEGPEALSEEPEALSEEPEALSEEPEALSEGAEALSEELEALSEEPEALSEEADALSEEPEGLSGEADALSEEPAVFPEESPTHLQPDAEVGPAPADGAAEDSVAPEDLPSRSLGTGSPEEQPVVGEVRPALAVDAGSVGEGDDAPAKVQAGEMVLGPVGGGEMPPSDAIREGWADGRALSVDVVDSIAGEHPEGAPEAGGCGYLEAATPLGPAETIVALASTLLGPHATAQPGLQDVRWPPPPPPPVVEVACPGAGEVPPHPLNRGLATLLAGLMSEDGSGSPGDLPSLEAALAPAFSTLEPWVEGLLECARGGRGEGAPEAVQVKPTAAGAADQPPSETAGEILSVGDAGASPAHLAPAEGAGTGEQPGTGCASGSGARDGAVPGEKGAREEPAAAPAETEAQVTESRGEGEFGLPWHLPADWFGGSPHATAWRQAVTEGEAFLLSRLHD